MHKYKARKRPTIRPSGGKHQAFRHWHDIEPEYEPPYKPRILKDWPPAFSFAQENIEVGYL